MEVHAHSHTARKKWTHYFWEFLMLFLAVFCGFLAEYQLEHKIEKDREKQYIYSLLKELVADTAQLNTRLNFRIGKMKTLDTLMFVLKSANLKANTGTLYYHGFYGAFATKYIPNNGVLSQLKNAGGLRLIRKQLVVDSLLGFDTETQWIVDFEDWERDRFMDASPYENILDASVFESHLEYQYPQNVFILKRITGNPPLLSERKEDIDKCYNRAQMQKRLNAVLINRFYNLKSRIIRLMDFIKAQYHLE
jgi:hypothetical protein